MKIRFIVYRYFDENDILLYAGYTGNFAMRNYNHELFSKWFHRCVKVTMQSFESKESALLYETEVIKKEGPLFNVTDSLINKRKKYFYQECKHREYVVMKLISCTDLKTVSRKTKISLATLKRIQDMNNKAREVTVIILNNYFQKLEKEESNPPKLENLVKSTKVKKS